MPPVSLPGCHQAVKVFLIGAKREITDSAEKEAKICSLEAFPHESNLYSVFLQQTNIVQVFTKHDSCAIFKHGGK